MPEAVQKMGGLASLPRILFSKSSKTGVKTETAYKKDIFAFSKMWTEVR